MCRGETAASLTREALRRVSKLASLAQPAPRILVNDRLDVALAEKAGGVHLGENSLPVVEAKRLVLAVQAPESLASDFLVGVSCHSLEAAQSAASAGADYIFFGPIFATLSKAAYGAPQGLLRLAKVCSSLAIPVLAIGGITVANVSSCFSAGASGIAAIRMFQDSADPAEIVRRLQPAALLNSRRPAARLSATSTCAAVGSALRDKHRAMPRHRFAEGTSLPAASPAPF